MSKYLKVGVKFWNQKFKRWETNSFDMDENTKIGLTQYNVTYRWYDNYGSGSRHNIEVAGRTNNFGTQCTVENGIGFIMDYDSSGWPVLQIVNISADNWDFQSCIFERVSDRLGWIKRYREDTSGYDGDVPWYQWVNNIGCIQRPTQLCIENMNGDGTFPSNPGYVWVDTTHNFTCHSYGHLHRNSSSVENNQMSNILHTIQKGNIPDGDNTVNVFDSEYHQWNPDFADSQAWHGPVTSSLIEASKFSNILSLRRRMGYYSLYNYNPFGSTGNRMCNTPGWWEAHCLRNGGAAGNYPWNTTGICGPYNALDIMSSYKAVSASLFELRVMASPSIGRNLWCSPMMGAIDAYSSINVTNALNNVMHLQEYNYVLYPAWFDNSIYTTLGGPNVSISGEIYPSSVFINQSSGSVGIRVVTYEGDDPVKVTSANYKHIIDCLIVPSLYSDWMALDIYGLQHNKARDWGSHFIWDSKMPTNMPNTPDLFNDQWVKLYSTVNMDF